MHPTVSLNLSQRVNSKGIKRVKKRGNISVKMAVIPSGERQQSFNRQIVTALVPDNTRCRVTAETKRRRKEGSSEGFIWMQRRSKCSPNTFRHKNSLMIDPYLPSNNDGCETSSSVMVQSSEKMSIPIPSDTHMRSTVCETGGIFGDYSRYSGTRV